MRFTLIILLSLLLFSCKKDKLDNEAQLLIGRWKLIGGGGGYVVQQTDNDYYELEFLECGKIKKWKDGKCKERGYFKKITVAGNYLDAGDIYYNVEAKSSSPFEDEGFCDRWVTLEIVLANSVYNSKPVDVLIILFQDSYTIQFYLMYERTTY
ncbi:MAG: hypothetical protein K1X56_07935 [Flavobacteriales bacterium]|nr:hypothetical protein [Flavobacteriales bacterium]